MTARTAKTGEPRRQLPLLTGDCLTQKEFHRRYETYPEDEKYELIGGIVYMAPPVLRDHGTYHPPLSLALTLYEAATVGVEVGNNMTTILGETSEPQPDLMLRRLTEFDGQSS